MREPAIVALRRAIEACVLERAPDKLEAVHARLKHIHSYSAGNADIELLHSLCVLMDGVAYGNWPEEP